VDRPLVVWILVRILVFGTAGPGMRALAWHIMMRLREDAVIAPSADARRTLARIFHRHGREAGLLAFGAADTHIHSVVVSSRETAGEFARRVEITLQYHLKPHTGFAPAHLKPIRDMWHLENALHYVLRQRQRHRLRMDPFHDGTCLPDLLGLRVGFPGVQAQVEAHLSRFRRESLHTYLAPSSLSSGLTVPEIQALVRSPNRQAVFLEAGLSAFAGRSTRCADRVRAKGAAAQALTPVLSQKHIAELLGTSPGHLRRLRRRTSPALRRATLRQIQLRAAAAPPPETI